MEAQKNTSGEKGVSIVSFTAAAKIKKLAGHDEMHIFSEKSRQIVSFFAKKAFSHPSALFKFMINSKKQIKKKIKNAVQKAFFDVFQI